MDADRLRARFEHVGQGHIFRFWDELDESQRVALCADATTVEFEALGYQLGLLRNRDQSDSGGAVEPGDMLELADATFPAQHDATTQVMRKRGVELLKAGKVALLTVAGGQGTRLGFDQPKGLFPIMPLSQDSLFATFARQLTALGERYGHVPDWLVMTSGATDAATKSFFDEKDFFGLDRARVHFFQQGQLPALDDEGLLVLESKHRLALSPDGHGGCLQALQRSGLFDRLEREGVTWIFYAQVDNVLARLCDPTFLGIAEARNAQASLKAVRKIEASEKVGVFGLRDGKATIVEYSELSDEESAQRLEDGSLAWKAGNIAIHAFQVNFLKQVADTGLPLHLAHKVVPTVDADGSTVHPTSPNAWKFERFIFDLLPLSDGAFAQEVSRDEEFLPLKSATGPTSPQGVAMDLQRIWREQLLSFGVEGGRLKGVIELDAAFIGDPEFLREALSNGEVAFVEEAKGTLVRWTR